MQWRKVKSSDVMRSWLLWLSRWKERGSKLVTLRSRGTARLVPTMKFGGFLSCSGPNASQTVRQQLVCEDYDDRGFELTPWCFYLAVQMYGGEDVTIFKFHHLVLFHLLKCQSRDWDTSGGYLWETFSSKGIIQQKKTLQYCSPGAKMLPFHTRPAHTALPKHPVSTTVKWTVGWTDLVLIQHGKPVFKVKFKICLICH